MTDSLFGNDFLVSFILGAAFSFINNMNATKQDMIAGRSTIMTDITAESIYLIPTKTTLSSMGTFTAIVLVGVSTTTNLFCKKNFRTRM